MPFNFPKTLMVLLLCLTFVSQGIAATVMPYHMMNMSGNSVQLQDDAMMMDHSHHNMAEDFSGDSDDSSEDCCVKKCSCFTGGCSTIAALIKGAGNSAIFASPKILPYAGLLQSQQLTSLYRPPILS